jgi:hypothetical protein
MEPRGRNQRQPDLMKGASDGRSTVVASKRRGSRKFAKGQVERIVR